jgi:hypothetical protein
MPTRLHRLHHLVKSLLPLLLPPVKAHERLHHLHRYLLVVLLAKTSERLFGEISQRHADMFALIAHLSVMKFGLDSRRIQLNNLHITARVLQLLTHSQNRMMQSRFSGAVVRAVQDRHQSQARSRVNNRRLLRRLFLQERQESFRQTEHRRVVCVYLEVHLVEVDGFRFSPVHGALQAGVHPYAVDVRVFGEDVGCERWDGLVIGDVEDGVVDGYVGVGAVLLDEFLEVFLTTAADDYACAGFDELGGLLARYRNVVWLMESHTFAARAQPMPLVAPRTRTFLYWREGILVNIW